MIKLSKKWSLLLLLLLTVFCGCEQETGSDTPIADCIDYDGNIYRTVRIGAQVWMAENLRTTHYMDGSPIPDVIDDVEWSKLDDDQTGAYCAYENDPENAEIFGYLYNWYAVEDPRELAPPGWHVPIFDEWTALVISLGVHPDSVFFRNIMGQDEASQLICCPELWQNGVLTSGPNPCSSGFDALPAGVRSSSGWFGGLLETTLFWSISGYSSINCFELHKGHQWIERASVRRKSGCSVRCVKD